MYELVCQNPLCRKPFRSKHKNARYCPDDDHFCRRQAYIVRRAQRIGVTKEAKPPAAVGYIMPGYCICGKPIQDGPANTRFCSPACKQEAWRFWHGLSDTPLKLTMPSGYFVYVWPEDRAGPMPWELDE